MTLILPLGLLGPVMADNDPANGNAPVETAADPDAPEVAPAEGVWIDPTIPDLLLGNPLDIGEEAAPLLNEVEDGPTRPEPDADPDEQRRANADAAPALRPGFVDEYTRLWRTIEQGVKRVKQLKTRSAAAAEMTESASADRGLAVRVRNLAEFDHAAAAGQLDIAVKDLYITGTTDVDMIISVLGSEPDDLLDALDSVIFLRSASGEEDREYRSTRSAAERAHVAAATSAVVLEQAQREADKVERALAKARSRLADDRDALDRLIAAAAPQTVVGPSGCPKAVLDGTVPAGVDVRALCQRAVKGAGTPQAAFAIKWALVRLGAPYACDGVGRLAPWRYDCSSYVARAYAEGAGLRTALATWAPSTRNMLPWDGAAMDPHYAPISPDRIKPGDLVLYDTCPQGEVCPYRHVVMYLGPVEPGGQPYMAHTNECGSVAHVAPFWGTNAANFLGVRRVIPAQGERVQAPKGALTVPRGAKVG